jgi:hypothetical protein
MNAKSEIDLLLQRWEQSLKEDPLDEKNVLLATEAVLVFLSDPATDTHENCTKVDAFVCLHVVDVDISNIGPDLQGIIGDMGQALHDTHTHPEIAINFQSTPQQLLARLHAIRP